MGRLAGQAGEPARPPPGRTTPIDSPPESPALSRAPSVGETQDEKFERLTREVQQRTRDREIQKMQTFLERGIDEDVEEIGAAYTSRKRALTASAEDSISKQLKVDKLPTFKGLNMKEVQTFNVAWSNFWKTKPEIAVDAWQNRIAVAGSYTRDKAALLWSKEDLKEYQSWDQFLRFMRSVVRDPAVRAAESLMALGRKQQRTDQDVRTLLAEIEELEGDIPELTKDQRDAWTLLLALDPKLRTHVLREHETISSREQVLSTAIRHEDTIRFQRETEQASTKASKTIIDTPPSQPGSVSGTFPRRTRGKAYEKKPFQDSSQSTFKGSSTFPGACHNCGKSGHKAFMCNQPKTSGGDASGKQAGQDPKK